MECKYGTKRVENLIFRTFAFQRVQGLCRKISASIRRQNITRRQISGKSLKITTLTFASRDNYFRFQRITIGTETQDEADAWIRSLLRCVKKDSKILPTPTKSSRGDKNFTERPSFVKRLRRLSSSDCVSKRFRKSFDA